MSQNPGAADSAPGQHMELEIMLDAFWDYLKQTDAEIKSYFTGSRNVELYKPDHLRQGVMAYLLRPAKRLRPAVMKLACGCLGGGDLIEKIIPAAAGLELFHTWTLVHDDIIDNDDLRRGQDTVHKLAQKLGGADLKVDRAVSEEYGRSIAILAGDIQHGWVTAAFLESVVDYGLPADVIIHLLHRLETHVVANLIYGEVLDVQFSLVERDEQLKVDEEQILKMEWLKTGVLYEFAAQSGAMIGKGTSNFDDPEVRALADFAVNCGIAFQLQDDILGIVGDEKQLGKPIGSDIREGKKTVLVLAALKNADEKQRSFLEDTLGDRTASEADVKAVSQLIVDLGGVDYAKDKARSYIARASASLDRIPASEYKDLLYSWAEFMVNREL